MWQILLAISIFSPSKLSNAQQNKPKDPPPQIIYFLAEDKVAPEEVKFRDNSVWQLVLPCRATGSNPLEWVWKHNDVEINKFKFQFNNNWELSSDGTLRAKGLNISDSGTYQCFVQDTVTKVSTFSRKLRVKVTAVGDFKSKEGFTKSTKLGEPLNVACPQRGPSFGATFAWTSKKARSIQFPISNRVAIDPSTGNLHIMYITQEDVTDINTNFDGIRCTISAANTFYDSGAFTLQILPGKNTKLSSPSFTPSTSPSNEKAVEGRTKDLYCEATARPPPTLVWKKDGVVIKSGEDFIEIPEAFEGRLLSITSVKESSHETIFTCEASNNQTIASGPAKRNFNLDVEVAPRWTSKAPDSLKEIPISSNGTLSCDVYAQPEPVIKWYRDGTEITQSSAKIEVSGSKLLFKDITLDKAGIYQCSAENVHGMIVSSTYVKVLAIAPSFRNGFGPFYLFQDSEGRLKCEPEAAPRPSTFKWFDENGAEIKSGNGYTIEQDGTLVISKVERSQHAGKFSCYAHNFLGNATAEGMATVYDKTRIVLGPSDLSVNEGTRVDLRCEAEADSSLELHYTWKRDDATIEYNRRVQWLRDQNVLTIADLTVEDAGIYTCVAYTPQPKYSEAKASAIVNIAGAPFPPTNLMLSSDCQNRNTTLSWVTGESNNASILYFLIERKSQYADDFWQVIANVTNPNATSHPLVKLAGNADLAFRIRAVNRFGPSRPSEPTGSFCRTIQAVPEKWPDNFRGVPGKAEELTIAWTAMRRVEWNGPGLYYKLWYRKVNSNDALVEVRREASSDSFVVPDAGYYVQWEFQIQAINEVGEGPKSPLVKQFSGQDPPEGKPEDVTVGTITARSVELSWKPVTITRGSVDGYRIYFWGESRVSVSAKRRRRAIPGYASVTNVTGVNTARYTVTELKPFFNYKFVITAYNSGGNGPESDEVAAATDEAAPGPPSNVQVFVFAKYILVTWQPPSEPNGVITDYRVGTETYTGSQPTEVTVNMQETGVEARRKLLRDLEPETNYVVEMQAATSKGWGTSFRKTEKTVAWAAPAKPEKPTVEGSAVDEVRVYYNFGLGGGYTHEFLVMFRKKLEGEGFLNTSWVDHFQQQSIIIGNLDPELYQFKTVARNDYPSKENPQESPASDITEARPLPGISNTGKRVSTPIYQSAWFIALLVLIALLLLVLLIFVLYTRHQGAKYRVGKREKKRAAALIDREQFDEEEGPFSNNGRADHPPPYVSQGSLPRGQESDRDSLDDYGEGPQFNEDGSFIEEYGDEKKAPPEEKDPSSLATFV